MTHSELCDAATRWLRGTLRCNIALSGIASTAEIPDAIGWRTGRDHCGSIVVECKTSVSDFHANKRKSHGNRMGNWRYFLVPDSLIPLAKVWDHYPNHGLLYLRRGRVTLIQRAKENTSADLAAENRLLQFALVHVRGNLLHAGCSVDMDRLTKHPITNHKGHGRLRWPNGFRSEYGIDIPLTPSEFLEGEMR